VVAESNEDVSMLNQLQLDYLLGDAIITDTPEAVI
jgi:hypothetical protein